MPPSLPMTGDAAAPALDTETASPAYKNPFLWVPSSYLVMGLIYIAVGTLANIMFRNMGMENDKAAFWSSLLGFPYTFKFLWAPALELYKTKKFFVVLMQFAISAALVGVAVGLKVPAGGWTGPVLTLMAITAILGATQDIGTDGVYVTTLSPKEQAKYLGFQSMCWNGGALLAKGPFLSISGLLQKSTGSYASAWMIVMLAMGGFVFLGALWHSRILPPGAKALDAPKSFGDAMKTFKHALVTFFQKKDVVRLIAFAFLYRSAYGLLDKMGPLFLIDARVNHGLGLSNQAVATAYGTFGTGAFIVGSLVGGWIVSKAGLRKTLLILCVCINVPNVTFLFLSQTMPTNMALITVVITVEQLGWGIGAVGHMIYMMQQIAPGPYKTAHYTFATALMGACMMTTGAVSGYVEKAVGYQWFFIIVLLAAAPSLLATILAPFHHPDVTRQKADAAA
jgi:MFS transporter, PAT family, beta-lactamase induction signal transducer AmpG